MILVLSSPARGVSTSSSMKITPRTWRSYSFVCCRCWATSHRSSSVSGPCSMSSPVSGSTSSHNVNCIMRMRLIAIALSWAWSPDTSFAFSWLSSNLFPLFSVLVGDFGGFCFFCTPWIGTLLFCDVSMCIFSLLDDLFFGFGVLDTKIHLGDSLSCRASLHVSTLSLMRAIHSYPKMASHPMSAS